MPAFVTIAFPLRGDLSEVERVAPALQTSGVQSDLPEDDTSGLLHLLVNLGDGHQRLTLRAVEEDGWVAVALDLDEARYERSANSLGRWMALETLLQIADHLMRELGLPYCRVEEEAEADVAPDRWDLSHLGGITLVPRDSADRTALSGMTGVLRVDSTDRCWVVLRQLDPVPHHPAAWPPG